MAPRRNLRVCLLYQAVLANNERAAQQSCDLLSIALHLSPRAVSVDYLKVGVREKWELQRELLCECEV